MSEWTTCANCGIVFGVPAGYLDNRQKDKKSFYCPNGHSLSYHESKSEKLQKQLDAALRERDRAKQDLAYKDDMLKAERNQVIAAKGQITKLKKRAKAGVCPCCNRTFSNMAKHMLTKHPDLDPNVIELGKVRRARSAHEGKT